MAVFVAGDKGSGENVMQIVFNAELKGGLSVQARMLTDANGNQWSEPYELKMGAKEKSELITYFNGRMKNAILPYDSDTDYPVGAVTLKDGKFQKWDGAEWADFIKLDDSQITTWSGRTQEDKNKDFVSLHDYCLLNGTDETAKFILAVNEAKASNKKLLSFGGSIILSEDVSLRYLSFDLSQTLIKLQGVTIECGHYAGNSFAKDQSFGVVYQYNSFGLLPKLLTIPSIRVMGSKCTRFHFGQVDFVELYVSTDPSTYPHDSSIGYCHFYGGLVTRMDFKTDPRYDDSAQADGPGSANQWINSNFFYISRMMGITIDGSYPHNTNVFMCPTFEQSRRDKPTAYIKILHGNKNMFLNIRGESYPEVYFGEKTQGNIVERAWYSTTSDINLFFNYTNLGRQNKYTSKQLEASKTFDIIKLNSETFKQKKGYIGNFNYQQCTKRFINGDGAARIIYQTNIFDIDATDIIYFYCDSIDSQTSRYLARIYMYDADGNLILDGDDTWRSGANFNGGFVSQGFFEGSFNSLGQTWFNFLGGALSRVKKISITLLSASTYTQSRSKNIHVTLTTMRDDFSRITTDIKPDNSYNFVTSKPNRFIGNIGDTVVTNTATNYKCSFFLDSKLSTVANANATVINLTINSLSGLGTALAGDLIGIDLDSEYTHWTTVASLSGLTVTLTDALPSGAAIGNNVYMARLV